MATASGWWGSIWWAVGTLLLDFFATGLALDSFTGDTFSARTFLTSFASSITYSSSCPAWKHQQKLATMSLLVLKSDHQRKDFKFSKSRCGKREVWTNRCRALPSLAGRDNLCCYHMVHWLSQFVFALKKTSKCEDKNLTYKNRKNIRSWYGEAVCLPCHVF